MISLHRNLYMDTMMKVALLLVFAASRSVAGQGIICSKKFILMQMVLLFFSFIYSVPANMGI